MNAPISIPAIGAIGPDAGMISLQRCSDGQFIAGRDGVQSIVATGDRKVEFISFSDRAIAYVRSALGYPAYYPVHPVRIDTPVRAVLMDLDGTSVRSEAFWIWIIQLSIASLLDNPRFELEESDIPHLSGHSVSEHLRYCIDKYCPDKTVEAARLFYFEHTDREMQAILDGHGRADAFAPTPGLREFLVELKSREIKIGLVTSGLYQKAWPEIVSAFLALGLGDPKDFYDAIVTAGFAIRHRQPGTLGELSPKPHPWLYAEAARVGLGIDFAHRHHVIGIEDSGAGVCAIRLAGFAPIGFAGGNIVETGTRALCTHFSDRFDQILPVL